MADVVKIDGSHGEGGGQVLRTAVALSAITGHPIEITSVRANRKPPGFKPQHLAAVRAAAEICGAKLRGAEVGSSFLSFEPSRPVSAGSYHFEIGTAGSTALVVQTVLLPLALAGDSRVTVVGGTHNTMAPSVEYLEHVALPAFRRMGVTAGIEWPRAGFFPKGGGVVNVAISGGRPSPVDLSTRGRVRSLYANVLTSELPASVAERGAKALQRFLPEAQARVDVIERPSLGAGAAALIALECEGGFGGFTGLGERGKTMERVSEEAGRAYQRWWSSDAAVDEHLADQLMLPAVLAKGTSRWKTDVVTEHLRTVAWVVRQFIPAQIQISEDGLVVVDSPGYESLP